MYKRTLKRLRNFKKLKEIERESVDLINRDEK